MEAVAERVTSIAEKYGFTLTGPVGTDNPVVQFYVKQHLHDLGYPLDIVPASEWWMGIQRENLIEGVFGGKMQGESVLEIPDFYVSHTRWGLLAAYAGLELLKGYADATGVEILTGTPVGNVKMHKAMCKVFDIPGPTHYVFRYKKASA